LTRRADLSWSFDCDGDDAFRARAAEKAKARAAQGRDDWQQAAALEAKSLMCRFRSIRAGRPKRLKEARREGFPGRCRGQWIDAQQD